MPLPYDTVLLLLILAAGLYMAWNIGANDVANAMGTSVGSGALTLRQAILVAAVLEFSGAFFFGSHVSETVQNGIIDVSIFASNPLLIVYGMLSALLAAGVWLQIASYYGWPVSTTHSIVGAIIGFGAVVGGLEAVYWENVAFIVTSWILSPICGGIISYGIFMLLRRKIFYAQKPVEAAKQLTPPLVFFVVTILALIMVYKGLHNLNLHLTFFEAFCLSLAAGLIGAIISYYCVRKIPVPSQPTRQVSTFSPEISQSLEKAKKHLARAQLAATGDYKYQIALLLEDVDSLSGSTKTQESTVEENVEFAIIEKIFGYLQIMSACLMAFAHGANDVANAIGPLAAAVAVLTTGTIATSGQVPTWALALGGFGIVIGLATWGWRVIETIGKKITELTPTRGFAAEFGAAATIVLATRLGMPISTTHTLVGSVIGVGMARGIEALDLSTTRDIVISWIVTVPIGAIIAVGFFYLIQAIGGV